MEEIQNEVVETTESMEESKQESAKRQKPFEIIKSILDSDNPIVIWNNSSKKFLSFIEGRECIVKHIKKRIEEMFGDKLKDGESENFSVQLTNEFINGLLLQDRLEIITNEKGGLQIVLGVLETIKRVLIIELRKLIKMQVK